MKTEETLYIKILIWAYQKQEAGFLLTDLIKEFNLTKAQENWVLKVFRSNMPAGDNLFDHLPYDEKSNKHTLVITAKGTSAAIDYLNLKEAERSGRRAERIALASIVIAIVVGILQMAVAVCSK